VTQPLDRTCQLPARGDIDEDAGEFWVENPFFMRESGHNLSAYERNRLFMNAHSGPFVDLSHGSNVDLDADSRGAVAADFDRDGDLDLLVVSAGGGPLRLFRNDMPAGNTLRVRLNGRASNHSGIGARLSLTAGDVTIHRDCFAHDPFSAQGPADLLIGVGAADSIDELTIRWPSGTVQQLHDVPVDETIEITEPD